MFAQGLIVKAVLVIWILDVLPGTPELAGQLMVPVKPVIGLLTVVFWFEVSMKLMMADEGPLTGLLSVPLEMFTPKVLLAAMAMVPWPAPAPLLICAEVPALMFSPPLKVLAPVNVSRPLPAWVMAKEP